jgi:hypothetical protein
MGRHGLGFLFSNGIGQAQMGCDIYSPLALNGPIWGVPLALDGLTLEGYSFLTGIGWANMGWDIYFPTALDWQGLGGYLVTTSTGQAEIRWHIDFSPSPNCFTYLPHSSLLQPIA